MLDAWLMMVELSVVEQRYQAVLAVIRDGESIVDVASRVGVSRQTVHAWLSRYESGGLAELADRSHRPRSSPVQMPAVVEAQVLEWRRQHPGWGPRRLLYELERAEVAPLPSLSGIYRALKRASMIEAGSRRRRSEKFRRWERGSAMELWQFDVVGGVALVDGTELKALTGVDDHSRFCVSAGLMVRANARSVCEHFADAMRRWGVPGEILTDNGKVFTGRFGRNHTEVLFDRICRENGIEHLLTAPRSPTTTGKIERFHRSLRTEFLTGRTFASIADAQTELDVWVADYNHRRPHQGIGMEVPAARFGAGTAGQGRELADAALRPERVGGDWIARRVCSNGVVSVAWQQFSVGKHRAGATVDIHVQDQMLQVWDGDELLRTVVRDNNREVRKKRASGQRG